MYFNEYHGITMVHVEKKNKHDVIMVLVILVTCKQLLAKQVLLLYKQNSLQFELEI